MKKLARTQNSNGQPMDDQTDVTSYFVDDEKQQPISKDEITKWVSIYMCGRSHSKQQ